MRTFHHWRPRYVVDRSRDMLYRKMHPDAPWLTPQATQVIASLLHPTDQGFESGSGRSTVWLAERVAHLTSVEHDHSWHDIVSKRLKERRLDNVDYVFAPCDLPAAQGSESEYARTLLRFPDESLDFALVDGAYREQCALLALPKLVPGGLLIIDNVNWFLPCESRAPSSRTHRDGPKGPVWNQVWQTIREWRTIWTSNGVWDTAIFIKGASPLARRDAMATLGHTDRGHG